MATTDSELESIFCENHPHTSNAIQKLLMAMEDVYNHRGKRSFFGHDKGLKSYEKFDKRLKELINCMILDELIPLDISSNDCRRACCDTINMAMKIWPNWHEAYAFAREYFDKKPNEANSRIEKLLR